MTQEPAIAPMVTETEIRDAVEVLRGVAGPQQGLLGLAAGEGMARFLTDSSDVFWLGVHGGAGESTLADLLGGVPCHHRWPSRSSANSPIEPAHVFLVARQNHRGLKAAQLAARDWAAGSHPTITLHGLVVVADAPGKTPKALHNQTRITAGGVPRTWVLPWIEELRLEGTVDPESLAREPRNILTNLREVINAIRTEGD
ncbi:DUF6668 family protein [Arthrobacter sp. D2-10]